MSIHDDFAAYHDPSGLLHGQRAPTASSGNCALFTAEEAWTLRARGELRTEDKQRITQGIADQCEIPGSRGLFRRSIAFQFDQEGPDDYVGLASLSAAFPCDYAQAILAWGRAHFYRPKVRGWQLPIKLPYYYRAAEPRDVSDDVGAWLGRQPALIAHFKLCAGERLSLFDQLAWAFAVSTTGAFGPGPRQEGGQDSWALSWVLVQAARAQGPTTIQRAAISCFYRALAKAWPSIPGPGGMRAVFAQYFGDPMHPLAIWAED